MTLTQRDQLQVWQVSPRWSAGIILILLHHRLCFRCSRCWFIRTHSEETENILFVVMEFLTRWSKGSPWGDVLFYLFCKIECLAQNSLSRCWSWSLGLCVWAAVAEWRTCGKFTHVWSVPPVMNCHNVMCCIWTFFFSVVSVGVAWGCHPCSKMWTFYLRMRELCEYSRSM